MLDDVTVTLDLREPIRHRGRVDRDDGRSRRAGSLVPARLVRALAGLLNGVGPEAPAAHHVARRARGAGLPPHLWYVD